MWNNIRSIPANLLAATTWYRRGVLALWLVIVALGCATGDLVMSGLGAIFFLMDCLWVLDAKARVDKKKAAVTVDYRITDLSPNAVDYVQKIADLRSLQHSPRD